jgi:hypothetical protein
MSVEADIPLTHELMDPLCKECSSGTIVPLMRLCNLSLWPLDYRIMYPDVTISALKCYGNLWDLCITIKRNHPGHGCMPCTGRWWTIPMQPAPRALWCPVFSSIGKTLKNCRLRLEEEGFKAWWSCSSRGPRSSLWTAGASVVCLPQCLWGQLPMLSVQAHLQSYRVPVKYAQATHVCTHETTWEPLRIFMKFCIGEF